MYCAVALELLPGNKYEARCAALHKSAEQRVGGGVQ